MPNFLPALPGFDAAPDRGDAVPSVLPLAALLLPERA